MKKIRLTETELTNIIKRVISEDQSQDIVMKTELDKYIEENKGGLKGQFEIRNGTFFIITNGKITRAIVSKLGDKDPNEPDGKITKAIVSKPGDKKPKEPGK